MKYRVLGKDLKVSAVGLGCMGMSHAFGAPSNHQEMTELLVKAVDIGYTLFDAAECYGYPGHPHDNEELLGCALKPYRDRIVLATKFGISFGPAGDEFLLDSRPETIRASVEGSLKRLNTDHIDLYYQHRIDPKVPVEDVAGTVAELIQEGKVTHWGISEANEAAIREARAICPLTAIQNRYSMMACWHEVLFPVLEELNIDYVAFSPTANGFLTDRYDKNSKFEPDTDYRSRMSQFTAEGIDRNQELLTLVRDTAVSKNATPAQLSLAWMIAKKPWIVPIPGTRKINRLVENAGACDIELTAAEVKALDDALDAVPMSEVFGGRKY